MASRHNLIYGVLLCLCIAFSPGLLRAEAPSAPDATHELSAPDKQPASVQSSFDKEDEGAIASPQRGEDEAKNDGQSAASDDADAGSENNGNETQSIADPLAPVNRAMFHVNDKLYFWVFEPVSQGYEYVVPDDVRVGFANAYDNLKAPARIVNNLLQFRFKCAGNEFIRFLVNSVVGVGGFKDIAQGVLDINKQEADFGQTLGHYGIGHGIYIVWPVFGPSSLRDTVGLVGDRLMYPLTYISSSDLPFAATVGIAAHEKVNDTSFKIGDYESFIKAAIDPYIAMRDSFVQYRWKRVEESGMCQ
jgi:phospholipid-binding lipoprotein MlaA